MTGTTPSRVGTGEGASHGDAVRQSLATLIEAAG